MVCTHVTKKALWFIRFLGEVGYNQKARTLIFYDSQGNLALLKNPIHHLRTKHIDIQFHFVKEHISSNELLFEYCPTYDMVTNIFTKAIPRYQFVACRKS
jgi:hypothetical protein